MEVDAPATLLSLPKEVSDLVLSYLAPGEGGRKSILNLRAVSPTTKGWVDDLLPSQRRRILGKCEAEVELTKDSLENFLKTPSPPGVTSLRLKEIFDGTENQEVFDETIWNPFVEFWSPRLESLHLDGSFILKIPNSELIRLCSSSRRLRSLRCQEIDYFDENVNSFPKFLFQLEELSVPDFGVCSLLRKRGEMDFFHLLAKNRNLKSLELCSTNGGDIPGVINVINANKDNPEFKLTLGFEGVIPGIFSADPSCHELYRRLVASVASSKSSISIVNLSYYNLETIAESVGAAGMTKFYEKIEILSDFSEFPIVPSLAVFPNLKQIGTLNCTLSSQLNSVFRLHKLERLGIDGLSKSRAISVNLLPSSLTHLALKDVRLSPTQLMFLLNVIASNCPLLVSLKIDWIHLDSSSLQNDANSAQPPAPFSNLKTFTFEARFPLLREHEAEETCRMILLKGLRIHRLSLRYFQFNLRGTTPVGKSTIGVFESKTLTSFIKGPLGKSLLVFLVGDNAYPEEAAPLVMKLKSKALSNKIKLRKTHGIRLPIIDDSDIFVPPRRFNPIKMIPTESSRREIVLFSDTSGSSDSSSSDNDSSDSDSDYDGNNDSDSDNGSSDSDSDSSDNDSRDSSSSNNDSSSENESNNDDDRSAQ